MDGDLLLELCEAARTGVDLPELRQQLTSGATSARLVAAWFEDGSTVGLLARRPKGAKGQDKDEIDVALAGAAAEAGIKVFDPRLSTTYNGAGEPRRFGIELWLGEDEDGEQRPLRIGGEARGEPTVLDGLRVQPFVARTSRGEGEGLYVLAEAK
jgi:hypothetical protein